MYFLRAQQVVKVKAVWNWMVIFYFVLRLRLECFSIVRIVVCCQTRDILLLELPSSIIQQTVSSPLPRRHSHLTTLSRCPPHTGSWPAQFLLGFPLLFFDMKSSTGIWHFYRMTQSVFPWWIISVWTLRTFPFSILTFISDVLTYNQPRCSSLSALKSRNLSLVSQFPCRFHYYWIGTKLEN